MKTSTSPPASDAPRLRGAPWSKSSGGRRVTPLVNREPAGSPGPWSDGMPTVPVPVDATSRAQWVRGEQVLLPRLAARAGMDVVHSLANTGPARGDFARVVTVHDLLYRM